MSDVATFVSMSAGTVLLGEAINAAAGAVSGSVGSAIMRDAGHDGYEVLSGAQNGALGGAVLAIPVGIASSLLLNAFSTRDERGNRRDNQLVQLGVSIASSAAYTATGSAILRSAGHNNVMDVYHSGRAGLVGSATMTAAIAVLATLLGAATMCGILCLPRERVSPNRSEQDFTLRAMP